MKRLLTLGGTLALGALVLWMSDLGRLRELVASLDARWLPLLALTAPLLAVLSVWKWWLLLRARLGAGAGGSGGAAAPGFWPLLGLYATGQFYNQVLPSNSGGDVVRGELLARRLRGVGGGDGDEVGARGDDPGDDLGGESGGARSSSPRAAPGRAAAYASITAERFTGLAVLVAMAIPAALVPAFWSNPLLMAGIGAGTLLSLGVMAGVLLVPEKAAPPASGGRARRAVGSVRTKLAAFSADLRSYRAHRGTLVATVLISVGFYAAAVASVVVAAACFGQPVGWPAAAAATAAVLIVSLLPISINGLGLWEAAFLATFEALGLGGELGLAVALLIRARDLGWAVVGAAVAAAFQGGASRRWAVPAKVS